MATIVKKSVLLLKAEKAEGIADKYEKLLRDHDFEVITVKTLDFVYQNLERLKEKLLNPDDYSGLIFSSPRCVNATNQTLAKAQLQRLWSNKLNFTVGEATFQEAVDKLGLECQGKETGNAKILSQLIIERKALISKPFLFPHGNLKTDTLKLELGKENIKIEGVLVYETIPNSNIEQELAKATANFTEIPEFLVLFSPSGLNSALPYLKRTSVDINQLKLVAIGPVTELAILNENLKVWSVAKSPTPVEVLNSLQL